MKLTIEQLEARAREYFLHGGGGFEDGEDGARAVSFSFSGMVDMAAAFAEYETDTLQSQIDDIRKLVEKTQVPGHDPSFIDIDDLLAVLDRKES